MSSADDDGGRPVLRVIRGDATDEEIAALLAVVSALSAARNTAAAWPGPASVWNDRSAAMRRPLVPGPGVWRACARPR